MGRHLLLCLALQLSFVSSALGSEWPPLSGSRAFDLTSIRGEAPEKWRPLGSLGEWYRLDQLKRLRPSAQRDGVLSIPVSGTVQEQLGALIEYAESKGSGYDAIHRSAKRLPEQPPTRMTLSDIFEWIRATPGQPHAIGRYQIIPSTLAELTGRLEMPLGMRFSPDVQDMSSPQSFFALLGSLRGSPARLEMKPSWTIWHASGRGFPWKAGFRHMTESQAIARRLRAKSFGRLYRRCRDDWMHFGFAHWHGHARVCKLVRGLSNPKGAEAGHHGD